jgi:hypothetical protein
VRTLEVKFLGKFESIFKNALAYESGDQLGSLGEITLDKKNSCYCPFKWVTWIYSEFCDTEKIWLKVLAPLN